MVVSGDWDWYEVTSSRWWCATNGLGPVSQVFRRAAVEFESLIGREDIPASDALLDQHVPCSAQGREAGSNAHHSRFFGIVTQEFNWR